MNINELVGILNGYFSWNKSRMECFAAMLIALIKVRTVNLIEISCGFPSLALQDSRYTRIKRFFREFTIDFYSVSVWVIHCFSLSGQALHLSIDRKNWRRDIETLFSCLKGRGFNFEDTRMTEPERIEKLLVLLSIAFCWAHKTQEWRHLQG